MSQKQIEEMNESSSELNLPDRHPLLKTRKKLKDTSSSCYNLSKPT